MNVDASTNQLTSLVDNHVLARLERLRLQPNRRKTNRTQGEHASGKGGSSTEFADYRNYVDGDDIRFVDWNIFARLNRPFMKLYQYEEVMHVAILVDGSSSMKFEGKFERACQLAAALGLTALMGVERISAYVVGQDGQPPVVMPPCSGRANMKRLFDFFERAECGGDAPIDAAVEAMLRRHRGKGLAIVLSDFLTPASLARPFNLLYSAGLEIFALQVLGPTEIDPELSEDLAGDVVAAGGVNSEFSLLNRITAVFSLPADLSLTFDFAYIQSWSYAWDNDDDLTVANADTGRNLNDISQAVIDVSWQSPVPNLIISSGVVTAQTPKTANNDGFRFPFFDFIAPNSNSTTFYLDAIASF